MSISCRNRTYLIFPIEQFLNTIGYVSFLFFLFLFIFASLFATIVFECIVTNLVNVRSPFILCSASLSLPPVDYAAFVFYSISFKSNSRRCGDWSSYLVLWAIRFLVIDLYSHDVSFGPLSIQFEHFGHRFNLKISLFLWESHQLTKIRNNQDALNSLKFRQSFLKHFKFRYFPLLFSFCVFDADNVLQTNKQLNILFQLESFTDWNFDVFE